MLPIVYQCPDVMFLLLGLTNDSGSILKTSADYFKNLIAEKLQNRLEKVVQILNQLHTEYVAVSGCLQYIGMST